MNERVKHIPITCYACGCKFLASNRWLRVGKHKPEGYRCSRCSAGRKVVSQEEVRKLYESRVPVVDIAKKLNVSTTRIYEELEVLGITRSNSESHINLQIGPKNGAWKGGRTRDGGGYIKIRIGTKQCREHRVVAEQLLGRPLVPGEVVHHKNGIKTDNRPENIEVFKSHSEHMRHHMTSGEAARRGRLLKGKKKLAALRAHGVEVDL